MKRFILTGTPGAGKTAILRQLERDGFGVVEEAATDVIALCQARGIAEPWKESAFLGAVTELQKQRQLSASRLPDAIQFYDRSPVCTAALAEYLGIPIPAGLEAELRRIRDESIYRKEVFFIRNLGFISPTEARRISWEEALRFERIHEARYRQENYEIVFVEPGEVMERAAMVRRAVEADLS